MSAFTSDNRKKGALAVFLRAVENGIVKPGSFLLVESLDRLSRDTLSAQMTLFMELVNAGITVVTLTDGKVYNKETIDTDISSLMLSLVIMMRSHDESVTKSNRLVAKWKEKRRDIATTKLSAKCPHWLVLNADRKSFRILEDRADIVRRIFQMSIDGMGQIAIAKQLNREQVPSWGRSKGWYWAYVQRLLRNPAVLGEFQPCRRDTRGKKRLVPVGDPIKNYYPPIIDILIWQRAQARAQTSTPGRVGQSKGNLFSGLAFDGYSAAPMRHLGRGHRNPPQPKKGKAQEPSSRYYYLVSDYQRLHPGAKAVSWRYEWFEKWFLDYIIGLDWSAITTEKIPITEVGAEKSLAEVRTKLDAINLKLGRLTKLATSTDEPPATIVQEMAKLEEERTSESSKELALAKELEALTVRRASLTEAAVEFKDLVARGDVPSRLRLREEIRRRISRIDVFPNGADDTHLKDEPIKAPGWPAFKITFSNGATRWVFCESRKPQPDGAAVLDSALPPGLELELRERPEVSYETGEPARPRRNVLVPVYVPRKSKRTDTPLSRSSKLTRARKKSH